MTFTEVIETSVGFPDDSDGKESACRKPGFNPWVRKILWRREWQHNPSFLAWEIPWTEESDGLYSPRGHKDLIMTEHIPMCAHTHTHNNTCIHCPEKF